MVIKLNPKKISKKQARKSYGANRLQGDEVERILSEKKIKREKRKKQRIKKKKKKERRKKPLWKQYMG